MSKSYEESENYGSNLYSLSILRPDKQVLKRIQHKDRI